MQNLLRNWYGLYLLFTEFRESIYDIRKILEGIEAKVVDKLEPEAVDVPESEIVDESKRKPEMKEPLIETFGDLLAELTIEIMSFSPSMIFSLSLRLLDGYDHFQIFLQETSSQEVGALICGLIFSVAELPCYAARILFEVPLTAAGLQRKSVPPPSLWFIHDASVLIPLPSFWPD